MLLECLPTDTNKYSFVCFLVLYILLSNLSVLFFVLFCVLFQHMYIVVSFPFVYKFIDQCHRVETKLQLM